MHLNIGYNYMYKDQNTCGHEKLTFGSGDFYIFCVDCGRSWIHKNTADDTISYDHGHGVDGGNEYRVKFPNNLTFLECKYDENHKEK